MDFPFPAILPYHLTGINLKKRDYHDFDQGKSYYKKGNAVNNAGNRTGAGIRTYAMVWAALMLLTALTVTVADMNFQKAAIIVCLGIAVFKSTLVLLYFMHLRYEDRLVVKLAVPIALATLAIFIGLTFSDVFTR